MKKPSLPDEREKVIVKHNDLIQKKRFSLSTQQQKIILYLISQISMFDEDFKVYEFDILEFCAIAGIRPGGKNYTDLKAAVKEIADMSMWAETGNGKESLVRWIDTADIEKDSRIIQIRLHSSLKPYLLQLTENFTKYELIFTLALKSKYAIRLYELICSIHYRELEEYTQEFDLESLKGLIDALNYTEYRDFKKRCLLSAIEEINEQTDKIITFEEVKEGRKVVAIKFTIRSKDSVEVLRIRNSINERLGYTRKQIDGQCSFFDDGQTSTK